MTLSIIKLMSKMAQGATSAASTANSMAENARILKNIGLDFTSFLSSFLPQTTCETFFEMLSKEFDQIIIETQSKENLQYVAGKCILQADDALPQMQVQGEFYYLQKNGMYTKKLVRGAFKLDKFTENARNELGSQLMNGPLTMDIEKP